MPAHRAEALEKAEGDNGQEEGNEDLQAEDGEDRTDHRLDEHLKQEHQEPEGHGAIEQQEEPVGDGASERVQQATPEGEGAVQASQEVLTGDVVGEQQDAVPAQEQKQGSVHDLSHKTMGPGQLPSDIEVPTELGFHPDGAMHASFHPSPPLDPSQPFPPHHVLISPSPVALLGRAALIP